jgi:acetyltransferase EpsM
MARHLAIGGAGGLARELLGWLHTAGGREFLGRYDEITFHVEALSLATNAGDLDASEFSAIGSWGAFDYLVAVSDPALKRRMDQRFAGLGGRAVTFIHGSCCVGRNVVIGDGSMLCPNVTISSDVKIGRGVLVNSSSGVGHNCEVGDYSALLGHVALNGGCDVGSDVVIGAGATIHPGRRVGDGALIGIGSTVISHVPPGVTVLGNPARRISHKNEVTDTTEGSRKPQEAFGSTRICNATARSRPIALTTALMSSARRVSSRLIALVRGMATMMFIQIMIPSDLSFSPLDRLPWDWSDLQQDALLSMVAALQLA